MPKKIFLILLTFLILPSFNSCRKIPSLNVICFGNSITNGAGVNYSWVTILDHKYPEFYFINEGRNGRRTSDKEELLPVLDKYSDINYFLIFLGVNDLKDGNDSMVNSCVKNIRWMINQIKEKNADINIAIFSPCKINLEEMSEINVEKKYNKNTQISLIKIDSLYRQLAEEESVEFISLLNSVSPANYTDGLHPDETGQHEIAETVYASLKLKGEIPRDNSYNLYNTQKKLEKNYPFIKPVFYKELKNIKEERNVIYKKINSRNLHLDLFYPFEKKINFPAVVLVHGGGWRTGDKTLLVPMAQQLASKGFITAAIEYRLSVEAHYPAAVYDIKDAVRWLRKNSKKYNIDTNKIAIYGSSAGGHLAALVGTTNDIEKFDINYNDFFSSKVNAIIDVDGVVDFFGENSEELYKSSGKPSAAHLWFGASPDDNPEIWHEASPVNYVNKNTSPVLFINSSISRFQAGQSAMIDSLKKYNVYYESHTIENTPHSFWLFHPWFDDTFNYTLNFLKKIYKD